MVLMPKFTTCRRSSAAKPELASIARELGLPVLQQGCCCAPCRILRIVDLQ